MKSIVLIAHGSRLQSSNDEAKQLVDKLAETLGENMDKRYPIVEIAFLELTRPSIAEAIERCIQQGANEVCLMPYFLCAGHHVMRDIPHEVKPLQEKYPHIPFHMTAHVGSSDLITKILCELVEHQVPA
jgi:sirohydrochlorin ferrochelatase